MKLDQYRTKISKIISEDNPVGEEINDHADYDYVESQLIKVGSLAHEEINWGQVEKVSLSLLEKQSKDFKMLGYLLQTMQYQATPERYNLSIAILADFINLFWESAYPARGGARSKTIKLKLLASVLERSLKAFDQLDLLLYDVQDCEELRNSLVLLDNACQKFEITSNDLSRLLLMPERINTVKEQSKPSGTRKTIDGNFQDANEQGITVQYAEIPQTKIVFDSSDERALKRTLNQISSFLNELKQRSLVIKIRRLALWHTIHSAPLCNDHGETELSPVPFDRVAEYKELLENSPDTALWERVEQSILLSPFWFDGHHLSSEIAEKLGWKEEADIIKKALVRFLDKIPKLKTLSFKGNIPFISETTQKWLDQAIKKDTREDEEASNTLVAAEEKVTSLSHHQKEITELFNSKGLDETVKHINDKLKTANDLRESCYWRLALADVYEQSALTALSQSLYESIAQITDNVTVTDWEPDLIKLLSRHRNKSK